MALNLDNPDDDDPELEEAFISTGEAPGATRIDKLRYIVAHHQALKIDGILADAFSAQAYTQVWDRLKPANRVKLDSMALVQAVNTVFKVIEKTGSRS